MKKSFVAHPFLFAIFPILSLFAHNIAMVSMELIAVPLAATFIFTLALFFLLRLFLKDGQKAGLIVSILVFLFFSYGHFYALVRGLMPVINGAVFEPRKVFLVTFVFIAILCTYFCIKTRRRLDNITRFLNIVAVSLIIISLINIGMYKMKARSLRQNGKSVTNSKINRIDSKKTAGLPDIYYIILDGYAREDVLKELYHYDNTGFIDYLAKKGFYVANKSHSNYCQTNLSLASSLNMQYLDALVDTIGTEQDDREYLVSMINNNSVFNFLKKQGYEIVVLSSAYYGDKVRGPDLYISSRININLFADELINTTPIPFIFRRLGKEKMYDSYRKIILNTFNNLQKISKTESPFLVFVHIMCPHPPFIFGPHGEEITPNYTFEIADGSDLLKQISKDEYVEGYRDQLTFLNKEMEKTVDAIISGSSKPPIIILQADHGPGSMLDWNDVRHTNLKERLSILNAYYFPEEQYKELYSSITPVNTFRMIFNLYFGTNYGLLDNKSYFSTWSQPYKFIEYTHEKMEHE